MSETNMPGEGDPPVVMTDTGGEGQPPVGGEGDPNAPPMPPPNTIEGARTNPPAMVEEVRPASVITPEMASSIAAVTDDAARQNIPETAMVQETLVSVANTIPDPETAEVLGADKPEEVYPGGPGSASHDDIAAAVAHLKAWAKKTFGG